MDAKKLLVGLIIALAAGAVFIAIVMKGKGAGEMGVGLLIPDQSCPKDASIGDFLEKMKTFTPENSPLYEPSYAVEIFKRYLACKNPRVGNSRFTSAEIMQSDGEIIACAKAAYVNYAKELDKKIAASAQNAADAKYYTDIKTNLIKEQTVFDAIFPSSTFQGKVCNYEVMSAGGSW